MLRVILASGSRFRTTENIRISDETDSARSPRI